MRRILRSSMCVLAVAIGILILPAGCASKRISTSVADQTFEPGQPKVAEAPPPPPAPVEETRVTEAPVPPPPPPMVEQPAAAAPAAVELVDVYFDFDKASLRSDARSALETNARMLTSEMKDVTVLIQGHCDEVGTAAYNLVLGEKRAQAVKRYLEDLGVPPSRMNTTSYGKERPFCTEHSPDCWQQNRRAHFAVK
ncbi:MAG: OmpA family protein [Nitrospirae bacterium]|nr:OmpA family protein [Nitrospirota bacterium]